MKFAYADPPYLGNGKRRYSEHADCAIWDTKEAHLNLVQQLCVDYVDGWVLSCNPADLRWLLPHCPEDCRIGAWVKTFHQIRRTTTQFAWETVIWRGGRIENTRKPMVRDWLACATTRKKGTIGAKPDQFNKWVLDLLNYDATQDTLHDLFPGSNGMLKQTIRGLQT